MSNPYDDLRLRFNKYTIQTIVMIVKEDLVYNGYYGDPRYEDQITSILKYYDERGTLSQKQKMVLINYIIH